MHVELCKNREVPECKRSGMDKDMPNCARDCNNEDASKFARSRVSNNKPNQHKPNIKDEVSIWAENCNVDSTSKCRESSAEVGVSVCEGLRKDEEVPQ